SHAALSSKSRARPAHPRKSARARRAGAEGVSKTDRRHADCSAVLREEPAMAQRMFTTLVIVATVFTVAIGCARTSARTRSTPADSTPAASPSSASTDVAGTWAWIGLGARWRDRRGADRRHPAAQSRPDVVGTVDDESRQGADGVGNVHDVGPSRLSQELIGWQYLARPPGERSLRHARQRGARPRRPARSGAGPVKKRTLQSGGRLTTGATATPSDSSFAATRNNADSQNGAATS